MTRLTTPLHPDFDRLSAYSDGDGDPEQRGGVASHLDRCSECRAVVSEIRALGDAARALPVAETPATLGDRILRALEHGHASEQGEAPAWMAEAIESTSVPTKTATAVSGDRARRRAPRGVLVAASLGAAATIVGLLAYPGSASLEATDVSRLTFAPGRPVPNGTMTVRYRAAAQLRGAPRLVLAGRYLRPANAQSSAPSPLEDTLDSLATLLPSADGSYEGRVHLPADFQAVRLMVFDSAGEVMDPTGSRMWTAIGGTSAGGPSLHGLLAAYQPSPWIDGVRTPIEAVTGQSVSVADSIQRYFPDHPAGWALYDKFGVRKGRFDFVWFFESAERKYASLAEALWPRKRLDPEYLVYMARFASTVEEPVESARWSMRFVQEHPDDPRAVHALADVLHEMELRDPRGAGDSIRKMLPLLDSLYRRSRAESGPWTLERSLVMRHGDSAARALWATRVIRPPALVVSSDNVTAESEALARSIVGQSCARSDGRFSVHGLARWTNWCESTRSSAWAHLSRGALARDEVERAQTLVDSAFAANRDTCSASLRAHDVRGAVRLARADSAGALNDFAIAYGIRKGYRADAERLAQLRGRAELALARRFDGERFIAAADSTADALAACTARERSSGRSTRQ